ncbi:hypothetical protein [Cysteiniphilum halobium]|uniref:hypothetical protein n=1 Tax=Cysteiniphilum halobium TaxID=2219059 RepID=UPI003F87CF53
MIVRYIEVDHTDPNAVIDTSKHKGSDKQLIVFDIHLHQAFTENADVNSFYPLIKHFTGGKILEIQNVKIRKPDDTDLPYTDFNFYLRNDREVRLYVPPTKSIPANSHIIITLIMGV